MSITALPDTIPFNSLIGSYRERAERGNVDTFQVEDGPPLEGIGGTTSTDQVSFDVMHSKTEFGLLLAFYRDTLFSGIKYFTAANPQTGTVETYKFINEPAASDNNSQKYRVSIGLRRFNY